MDKIYLSGPISKTADYKQRFAEAEEKIKSAVECCEVLNPTKIEIENGTWKDYMAECLRMLGKADMIYMMDGWKHSPGACMELGYALGLGIIRVHLNEEDTETIGLSKMAGIARAKRRAKERNDTVVLS